MWGCVFTFTVFQNGLSQYTPLYPYGLALVFPPLLMCQSLPKNAVSFPCLLPGTLSVTERPFPSIWMLPSRVSGDWMRAWGPFPGLPLLDVYVACYVESHSQMCAYCLVGFPLPLYLNCHQHQFGALFSRSSSGVVGLQGSLGALIKLWIFTPEESCLLFHRWDQPNLWTYEGTLQSPVGSSGECLRLPKLPHCQPGPARDRIQPCGGDTAEVFPEIIIKLLGWAGLQNLWTVVAGNCLECHDLPKEAS